MQSETQKELTCEHQSHFELHCLTQYERFAEQTARAILPQQRHDAVRICDLSE